jgi:hypothetical protein
MDASTNESHKIKYYDDVEYDKITTSEANVRAIEGIDLYDLVQAAKICLIPNVIILKKFHVPEFIKYTETQCPSTHLKSYYNKMTKVVYD